jgi:hypothetical protein
MITIDYYTLFFFFFFFKAYAIFTLSTIRTKNEIKLVDILKKWKSIVIDEFVDDTRSTFSFIF